MPETVKIVTRDEFVAASESEDGATANLGLVKEFATEVKAIDQKARTVDFVISTAAVDRMKDTVAVSGWVLDDYLKAPIVLWAHNSYDPPIGRALSVSKSPTALLSRAEFMDRDLSPFADTIFRMYEQKFLYGVSVGFLPLKYERSTDKERDFGLDFKSQILLEFSCCCVPANPECLVQAKAAGIDLAPMLGWAERLLDGEGRISVPRPFLEDVFKAAKTPRSVRQKYLEPALPEDVSTWQCAAANDLPMDKAAAWDGKAAAERMFVAAGFDGDAPDTEMARRGFLVYDSANPTARSSYKMPFCDIVDGELTAVAAGVTRAIERMPHAMVPDAVAEAARSVLEDYIPRIIGKSGKRISAANQALLSEAMDHHSRATECLKQVMTSNNGADEPDADDADGKPMDHMMDGKMEVSAITAAAIEDAVERAAEDASEVEEAAVAATAAAEVAEVARQARIRLANAKHTQALASLTAD